MKIYKDDYFNWFFQYPKQQQPNLEVTQYGGLAGDSTKAENVAIRKQKRKRIRVKICNGYGWYTNLVGQVVTVKQSDLSYSKYVLISNAKNNPLKYLRHEDCEVVTHNTEEDRLEDKNVDERIAKLNSKITEQTIEIAELVDNLDDTHRLVEQYQDWFQKSESQLEENIEDLNKQVQRLKASNVNSVDTHETGGRDPHVAHHNAIIVTGCNDHIYLAYNKACCIFPTVSEILPVQSRHFTSFFIPPDGTIKGRSVVSDFDKQRNRFFKWLVKQRYSDGSYPIQWVEVEYGCYESYAEIVRSSNIE